MKTSWSLLYAIKKEEDFSIAAVNEYSKLLKCVFTREKFFPSTVVDVGGGGGFSALPFVLAKGYVILADLDLLGLRLAKEKYRRLKLRTFDAILCDALHLPFRDKSVDLALSWGLLEHFDSPEKRVKILIEKARVSKMVMAIVPYRINIGYKIAKLLSRALGFKWPFGGEMERDYIEYELAEEFIRSGLKVIRLMKFGRTFGMEYIRTILALLLFKKHGRTIAVQGKTFDLIIKAFREVSKVLSLLTLSYDNLLAIGRSFSG